MAGGLGQRKPQGGGRNVTCGIYLARLAATMQTFFFFSAAASVVRCGVVLQARRPVVDYQII